MTVNIFSSFANQFPASNYINQVKKEPSFSKSEPQKSDKKEKVIKTVKTLAPIVVPLAVIPITAGITYKLSSKKINSLSQEVNGLKNVVENIRQNTPKEAVQAATEAAEKKIDAKVWALLAAAGGFGIGSLSEKDKDELAIKLSDRFAGMPGSTSPLLSGHTDGGKFSPGINLLKNDDVINRNTLKYDEAKKSIRNAASKYLMQAPSVHKLSPDSTIWSITSEFAPIKEGGLGSVPVEVQNNAAKLGVSMPAFVPLYQQKGIASLKQEGNEFTYTYKGNKFKLQRAAGFKLDTFQAGKSKTEDVEVFVAVLDESSLQGKTEEEKKKITDDFNKRQLVFIKNDTYFNGSIYSTNEKTEEAEKFAFFSKAVYEFAKAKIDENSVKGLNITDRGVFDSVKAPDGLILNDWQASPVAALARYKAPMENAHGQLSDEAAKKLSDINIITIGHNAAYQGSTINNYNDAQRYHVTTNILNTLFDNFASDIVENASSGAVDSNPEDKGLENINNVLVLNPKDKHANHTNLLNMGVCLSNYFHPVSENYAKELITEPEKSGELMWAMVQKSKSGSLCGIINGNDFDGLSIEAKKAKIKEQTGLDFKTYNRNSDISEIMAARAENKVNLYNNYMVPFSLEKKAGCLEFIDPSGNTRLSELSAQELSQIPVISMVGRLVHQKGIDIMADAIKMLFENWEQDFPGKNKPIFYLAGSDGENGRQKAHLENLKSKLTSKEDSERIIFGHGFAPANAISAASDFFMLPSRFEPCGLTQGESFAVGTPVIASAVGGIVDTVNRNSKTNGVLTQKDTQLTPETFYNAMKKALNIYFNNPEQYKKMVSDALNEDFSWIQKGKKGPVYDYLEKIGISREELPSI